MAKGDWAPGTTFRPLRAITEFDPDTSTVRLSNFEGEIYAPSGMYIKTVQLRWNPADPNDALTVNNLAIKGLTAVMTDEGLAKYVPPPAPV